MKKNYMKKFIVTALCALLSIVSIQAQCTYSCGTGSDGVYQASSNTTLAGGTYNFTSFTIDAGVTVTVTGTQPLIILCTGNVLLNGTLDVSGMDGTNGVTSTSAGAGGAGVAGGANGGAGTFSSSSGPLNGNPGNGPGMGGAGMQWSGGGGAGYLTAGDSSGNPAGGFGGPAYGNPQISPATAGSGGAGGSGGYNCGAGGGGGGGGYLLITACGTITISGTGSILSNGGDGGSDGTGNCGGGGGGSGGSILLRTNGTLTNNGLITAHGGIGGASAVPGNPYYGTGADGADGRIIYGYVTLSGSGSASPTPYVASPLASAAASTPASCASNCDGTLIGTVFGGIPNYTYTWTPGNYNGSVVNGVCPGVYTLTGTDASGCTTTSTATVTSPPPIVVSVAITNASCSCDGSVTASVSGGTAPYTYLWLPTNQTTPTAQGLCAGCYTITVTDANGCVGTQLACITAPAPLVTTVAQLNNVTCNGACNGAATVLASGGSGSYTYLWAPTGCNMQSCTNLCAGTYSVTVTDSLGCTSMQIFTITEPPAMVSVTTSFGINCSGACTGTAMVSTSGGTPAYTCVWAPGGQTTTTITNLCAGTYTVTCTDANGCTTTSTTTLTEPSQLTASSSHTDETSAPANDGTATATASGGSPGYTYLWMPGNQTTATATGLDAGTYTCTITDAAGCTTTVTVTVGTQIGIDPVNAQAIAVNLFPNPAQDHVQLSVTLAQKGNVHVELYNMLGAKMDVLDFGNVSAVNYSYETSHLANGIYFFRVTSGTVTTMKKVTVSH
jgi:hypothetical protein